MALAKSLSFERDPVLFRTNKIVWESYARKKRNYRSDRTRRALVVDDDEVFQEYVKKLLESLFSWVRVEVASDLASACEKIRESISAGKRYGFILCDVHLNSSNDGIEFWKYCTLVLDLNVPFAFISALPIDQVYEVLSH